MGKKSYKEREAVRARNSREKTKQKLRAYTALCTFLLEKDPQLLKTFETDYYTSTRTKTSPSLTSSPQIISNIVPSPMVVNTYPKDPNTQQINPNFVIMSEHTASTPKDTTLPQLRDLLTSDAPATAGNPKHFNLNNSTIPTNANPLTSSYFTQENDTLLPPDVLTHILDDPEIVNILETNNRLLDECLLYDVDMSLGNLIY